METINPSIEIVGYGPKMELEVDGKNYPLGPDEIIALAGTMTYKGKSVKEIAKNIIEKKGFDGLEKKVEKVILESAARGHASIATTTGLWLLFKESSKLVDSLFTGAVFSSSFMPSGRRTGIEKENIIATKSIIKSKFKQEYQSVIEDTIDFYKNLLSEGIPKDEASKILPYGMTGGGLIFLPLETIIGFKREFEMEKDWIPNEGKKFIELIEKRLPKIGAYKTYKARENAARPTLPYPNIFKDPTRNTGIDEEKVDDIKIINYNIKEYKGLKQSLYELSKLEKEIFINDEHVMKGWNKLLMKRNEICRDFYDAVRIDIITNSPLRVWGEVKRHRTLKQDVESVYKAINRATEDLRRVERYVSVPPTIKSRFKNEWIEHMEKMLHTYKDMTSNTPPRDAFLIIPRGLKLKIKKTYDLWQLLSGYIPLRLCTTAEEEMRRTTIKEVKMIKKILPEYIGKFIVPKCYHVGFCLEKETCGEVSKLRPEYNHEKFDTWRRDDIKEFL